MSKRIFLFVLDSFGIGEMPDAHLWNDQGSNTLASLRKTNKFDCPTLERLGLFHIDGVGGAKGGAEASFARMAEASDGKDTTIGHWEIAGLISKNALPTYPDGFPAHIISELEKQTGRKILCNKPYSGTAVIADYGAQHIKSGALIVYTSADSVMQIAAHEQVVPIDELYECCKKARKILVGEHGVGRVIARPFEGEHPFTRTSRRHDYSIEPTGETMLDHLLRAGYSTISVGKIEDIFAGRGISEGHRTTSNLQGMEIAKELRDRDFEGLCFINLVDFDSMYGHRNNAEGYARCMSEFDRNLSDFINGMRENDIMIITADHGADPDTPSTDHSREYVPMLIYGKCIKSGINLGTRSTFADIAATVLEYLGIAADVAGNSFLKEVIK